VRGYFFRSDRREWLVAMRASDYLELLKRAAPRANTNRQRGR